MAGGNPEYKDRLFWFVFGNEEHKEWTLSLYNAINGTHYDNPDDISIETIRQVMYMGIHNDVAFIIADQLSLYEQQSTFNPNMPLRMLEYTANLFEKYIKRDYLAEGRAERQETALLTSIRNLMKSLKVSAQQAMTLLGIPEAEQPNYLNRI